MLCIDWDLSEERLVFHKEGEGAVASGDATASAAWDSGST